MVKKLIYAGTGVAALVVCGLLLVQGLRDPHRAAGARLFDCLDRRDAGCLMEFASAAERGRLGLSEASLQEFLDKYYGKKLEGFRRFDGIHYDELKFGWMATQKYVGPDGRVVSVRFDVFRTGSEMQAFLVMPLMNAVFDAGPHKVYASKGGTAVRLHRADVLRRDLPVLSKLELKGMSTILVHMEKEPQGLSKAIPSVGFDSKPMLRYDVMEQRLWTDYLTAYSTGISTRMTKQPKQMMKVLDVVP